MNLDEVDTPPDLIQLLSAEERERAGRFAFARDRRRYQRAHIGVRRVLAQLLGASDPSAVHVRTRPDGKPFLADTPWLHFNLSHSDSVAVVAVSEHAEVGVDVESCRVIDDADAMVLAHFSPTEQAGWHSVARDLRDRSFLRCWTRKEAVVKAVGTGLTIALDTLDVGVGGERRRVRCHEAGGAPWALDLATVELPGGAIVSVAHRARSDALVDADALEARS